MKPCASVYNSQSRRSFVHAVNAKAMIKVITCNMQSILPFIAVYVSVIRLSHGQLPHPQCTYENFQNQWTLSCQESRLEMPEDFKVNKVPNGVEHIRLDCPGSYRKRYCNIMNDNVQPLPARSALREVSFYGFKGTGGPAPFSQFLRNVKKQITTLRITWSQIGTLNSFLLSGFTALERLYLTDNDIQRLWPGCFDAVQFPKLASLDLGHNALEKVDWTVFQPIAETLRNLSLNSQNPKLNSLIRSGPEFNLKLQDFGLTGSDLSDYPMDILRTLTPPPAADITYDFRQNDFCNKADCSCCKITAFMTWAKGLPQTLTPVLFTCGGQVYNNPAVISLDIYRLCENEYSSTVYEISQQRRTFARKWYEMGGLFP